MWTLQASGGMWTERLFQIICTWFDQSPGSAARDWNLYVWLWCRGKWGSSVLMIRSIYFRLLVPDLIRMEFICLIMKSGISEGYSEQGSCNDLRVRGKRTKLLNDVNLSLVWMPVEKGVSTKCGIPPPNDVYFFRGCVCVNCVCLCWAAPCLSVSAAWDFPGQARLQASRQQSAAVNLLHCHIPSFLGPGTSATLSSCYEHPCIIISPGSDCSNTNIVNLSLFAVVDASGRWRMEANVKYVLDILSWRLLSFPPRENE